MRNDPINPIARVVFMASTVGVNIAGWGAHRRRATCSPCSPAGFSRLRPVAKADHRATGSPRDFVSPGVPARSGRNPQIAALRLSSR